jgi:hypothetical protein
MLNDGTIGLRICPTSMPNAFGEMVRATDRLRQKLTAAGVSDDQAERMKPRAWVALCRRVAPDEFRAFTRATDELDELMMARAV